MSTTAIVLGTSRRKGNTAALVTETANRLNAKVYDLADLNITPYDYAHQNRNDDFLPLMRELVTYDHMVLASPIYWYSPSAEMKIFMDRFSDLLDIELDLGRQLRGMHGSVISTCESDEITDSFEDSFRHTFKYLGMTYRGMLLCVTPEEFAAPEHEARISAYIDGLT